MATERTVIRGLPAGTLASFRKKAAEITQGTGEPMSMNTLYVKALLDFLAQSQPSKRCEVTTGGGTNDG